MIRKIHQTAKTLELTEFQQRSASLIQEMNPTFSYKLWVDDEILTLAKEHMPVVAENWHLFQGIQKADIGRYLILYVEGGVYADTDIITTQPFENYLGGEHIYFSPSTKTWPWKKGDMTNYFIYSPTVKADFLKKLIEECVGRIKMHKGKKGFDYIPKTTGRIVVNEMAILSENVRSFSRERIIDKFCECTHIHEKCMAYHEGSTIRPGITWHKNYALTFVKIECAFRKFFRIPGNYCQAPIVLISLGIAVFLITLFFTGYIK